MFIFVSFVFAWLEMRDGARSHVRRHGVGLCVGRVRGEDVLTGVRLTPGSDAVPGGGSIADHCANVVVRQLGLGADGIRTLDSGHRRVRSGPVGAVVHGTVASVSVDVCGRVRPAVHRGVSALVRLLRFHPALEHRGSARVRSGRRRRSKVRVAVLGREPRVDDVESSVVDGGWVRVPGSVQLTRMRRRRGWRGLGLGLVGESIGTVTSITVVVAHVLKNVQSCSSRETISSVALKN